METMSITEMMKAMIPITRFNKGEANKIFDEVQTEGTKIVVKNNKPACILLSPARYESLIETLSDYMLYTEAENRIKNNSDSENLMQDDVMREFGISQDDLDGIDVEIE